MFDSASKGIGLGLGMIGMGIGLKFLSDTTKDLRRSTKKSYAPKMPKFKPYKYKY